MSGKSLFSLLVICLFTFSGCAQSRYGIRKAQAFFKVTIPGTIAVDENRNPVNHAFDTLRYVILEFKGTTKPEIQTIEWNGIVYETLTYPVENKQLVAGIKKNSDQSVVVTPKPGYHLLRIDLKAQQNRNLAKKEVLDKIVLNGKSKKGLYTFLIPNGTELNPDVLY